MKKMVIIGAGSAMFTQGLVLDLLKSRPGGKDWELALCDIDGQVLEDVAKMVKKMMASLKIELPLTWSTDRKDVLPGADYIVSTIGVGGRRAWELDVQIPRKYGIYQPVGDTAMPGGISRGMRMVPAMIDIVKDTMALAPRAKFFNYANPMAIICRAIQKELNYNMTGLCIGTIGSQWYISDMMGYERSRVTSLAAGINHCTFIYDYRVDGRDVWPEIRERVIKEKKNTFDSKMGDRFHGEKSGEPVFEIGEPFGWEFFLREGAFPAPGDRHVTEFFTELFLNGAYYGKKLGIDAYSFEGTIEWGDRIHQETIDMARSDQPLPETFFDHFHGEHEQLIEIIDHIERDKRGIFYANVQNNGAVPNLPHWAVIEIPCAATAKGMQPMYLPDFPSLPAAHTCRFLSGIEIAVDAALQGNKKLMADAILCGGYMSDPKAAAAMTDELIAAHRQYLPQFK